MIQNIPTMQQEKDHLKKQIDQLGIVLRKVLSDLLGIKQQGVQQDVVETTNKALKSEIDLDLNEFIALPDDSFIDTLISKKGFNNENLDYFTDILISIAERYPGDEAMKKSLYQKCLLIYTFQEKSASTYSFGRQMKTDRLKKLL